MTSSGYYRPNGTLPSGRADAPGQGKERGEERDDGR